MTLAALLTAPARNYQFTYQTVSVPTTFSSPGGSCEKAFQSMWPELLYISLQKQQLRGTHPFNATAAQIQVVFQCFVHIFEKASEIQRKAIANASLFTKNSREDSELTADSARPLTYIFLKGDIRALKLIDPYLTPNDYLQKGPHGYTYMHLLLRGMEPNYKGQISSGKKSAVECAEFLLKKAPSLASETTLYQTSPLQFCETVRKNLDVETRRGSYVEKEKGYIQAVDRIAEMLKPSDKK